MKARVGIVDDHPSVILGVRAILNAQSDMYVAAWGATAAKVLSFDLPLDVILLDLMLADG